MHYLESVFVLQFTFYSYDMVLKAHWTSTGCIAKIAYRTLMMGAPLM